MSKRAVLVGCNYDKTRFNLRGCINDVETTSSLLFNQFGFEIADVTVLTDAPKSKHLPTGKNIKAALKDMVGKANTRDDLFFYFSGHGTAVLALGGGCCVI
ncbi:hypothetical protein V6N13_113464 [Hibiscus sabdariffa]|uniref:Peptidase C14 caspase domain-containing protein n=1 Tax=Hibiscus sabdariffa TaxID=183260 RepID=A0ABR2CUS0_9ROSI